MHQFTIVFIAAVAAHLAVQLMLAWRQITYVAAHRDALPAGFAGAVTPEEHAKAADYTVARQRLGMLESVFETLVLLWLTLGGGVAAIGESPCA